MSRQSCLLVRTRAPPSSSSGPAPSATKMPSHHNRVSIFWLLCNMLSCSVQDISRSRLSKVDGICYGYSSHHLCGKVHRHDQQSIVSNKLPRLPLSWVIRSFFLLHLFEIEMKNNEISLQLHIIYQFLATINLSAFYGTTCPGIGLKV